MTAWEDRDGHQTPPRCWFLWIDTLQVPRVQTSLPLCDLVHLWARWCQTYLLSNRPLRVPVGSTGVGCGGRKARKGLEPGGPDVGRGGMMMARAAPSHHKRQSFALVSGSCVDRNCQNSRSRNLEILVRCHDTTPQPHYLDPALTQPACHVHLAVLEKAKKQPNERRSLT